MSRPRTGVGRAFAAAAGWLAMVAAISCSAMCPPARGGDSVFSAAPVEIHADVARGATITRAVRVTNQGTSAIRVDVTLSDFARAADGSTMFLRPAGSPRSCAKWIALSPRAFVLPAGETRAVKLKVSVPRRARDAEYRAAVILATGTGAAGDGLGVRGAIAAKVVLTVGQPQRKGLGLAPVVASSSATSGADSASRVVTHGGGSFPRGLVVALFAFVGLALIVGLAALAFAMRPGQDR